ncbi:MAG: ABC transporter ATP-binding protein [Gammaproteobacteria bacterium]|nr:ABC transporter ATP-binding protein [Gammaproteobacteria bacterium]NNC77557.1 ABC transporter ATP-binding protein [Woeseiaceae bacterium]
MKPDSDAIVATNSLCVRVPGRNLVEGLDLEFFPGEFIAVLGRNGTGKTLTTLTLAGLREPAAGSVALLGDDIRSLPRSAIAKTLALLPQSVDDIFPATVIDTALIGRHPHIPRFQWESAADREIAVAALAKMHIADLAERDVLTLSGGERRRLGVAQILAQAPDVYLLDEPTNHLDPQHQLDVLQVFRERADQNACVIASLHDVNLAARFADRCLLLYGDGRWDYGPTEDILDEDRLATLYGTPIESVQWRSRKLFVAASGT